MAFEVIKRKGVLYCAVLWLENRGTDFNWTSYRRSLLVRPSYSFICHLRMLSVAETMQRRTIRWLLMTVELERTWKEAGMSWFKGLSRHFSGRTCKTRKKLNQVSWPRGRNSNSWPSVHSAGILIIRQRSSVACFIPIILQHTKVQFTNWKSRSHKRANAPYLLLYAYYTFPSLFLLPSVYIFNSYLS